MTTALNGLLPALPGPLYDRGQVWDRAWQAAAGWCTRHDLPVPAFVDEMPPDMLRRHGSVFGCYDSASAAIYVNVRKCALPTAGKPVRAWSFTGYKADRTVPGVLFHELGHHVHFSIMFGWVAQRGSAFMMRRDLGPKGWDTLELRTALRAVRRNEAQVSSYEPNEWETWCEAFRLYLLNPDLLGHGRPQRYALLASYGLEPGHDLPWTEVLQHAHPAYLTAARNWMKK